MNNFNPVNLLEGTTKPSVFTKTRFRNVKWSRTHKEENLEVNAKNVPTAQSENKVEPLVETEKAKVKHDEIKNRYN